MKDAKGHGSDAHSTGVQAITNTYETAKAHRDMLDAESSRLGAAMSQFPKGPMGLTTNEARATPEWRAAKTASDIAFQNLRNFNSYFLKAYPNEIKADRLARRGGK